MKKFLAWKMSPPRKHRDINRDLDQEGSITTDGYNEGDRCGSIIAVR